MHILPVQVIKMNLVSLVCNMNIVINLLKYILLNYVESRNIYNDLVVFTSVYRCIDIFSSARIQIDRYVYWASSGEKNNNITSFY